MSRISRSWVGLILLTLLVGCKRPTPSESHRLGEEKAYSSACASKPSTPAEACLAIANVTVIDVTGGPALPNTTVLIRGDRITAIGPAAEIEVPVGATVLDITGKFLIPGLWDMHAHLTNAEFPELFVRHGITGVRHMFSINPFFTRKPAGPGGPVQPRVVAADQILDGPVTFRFPVNANVVTAADAAEARTAVRTLREKGNGFIKIYSGLPRVAYFAALDEAKVRGLMVGGHVPRSVTAAEASDAGQRTIEHLDGVGIGCSTAEARLLGMLRASDAAMPPKRFDLAIGWRVQVDAHETFDREKANALFKKFVANGTWHVPTLVQTRAMARLADEHPLNPAIEKQIPEFLHQIWEWKRPDGGVRFPLLGIAMSREDLAVAADLFCGDMRLVRRMHHAGVPLLAGTDTPYPFVVPGVSLHDELVLLVSAGLTSAEALRTATLNPAKCLKMDDQLGTIAVGKLADLVVLAKNPLGDIRNTRTVEMVLVGGRIAAR